MVRADVISPQASSLDVQSVRVETYDWVAAPGTAVPQL
jgi:hypothetical protein